MNPTDLLYAKSHEWVRIEGDMAVCGITHYAQEQLGDLTFVELPQPGAAAQAGTEIGRGSTPATRATVPPPGLP